MNDFLSYRDCSTKIYTLESGRIVVVTVFDGCCWLSLLGMGQIWQQVLRNAVQHMSSYSPHISVQEGQNWSPIINIGTITQYKGNKARSIVNPMVATQQTKDGGIQELSHIQPSLWWQRKAQLSTQAMPHRGRQHGTLPNKPIHSMHCSWPSNSTMESRSNSSSQQSSQLRVRQGAIVHNGAHGHQNKPYSTLHMIFQQQNIE